MVPSPVPMKVPVAIEIKKAMIRQKELDESRRKKLRDIYVELLRENEKRSIKLEDELPIVKANKKIESALGIAEVRNVFKVGRRSTIAGSYIKSGKAIRNAKLRIKRDEEIIHEGLLTSLKRFKDDVNEVKKGFEWR